VIDVPINLTMAQIEIKRKAKQESEKQELFCLLLSHKIFLPKS